jgi:hypothetical protein
MLTDIAFLVLLVYLFLLGLLLGIMIIPMFLVCQHTFDRVINKRDYPDYYGRGLSYGSYPDKEITDTDDEAVDYDEESTEMTSVEEESDFERVSDDED